MPKPRKLTPQEALVAAFFRHSISGYSTFHPQLFGNGREPADMVVVVGRAMILVNMHHGKSYFDGLSAHNIDQARDRIQEWKNGKPIRGENGKAKFHIQWSDIDFIHVISVVDGRHAACSGHDLSLLMMDSKVRLVTTLTSAVMHRIAKLGGGARDLIAVSEEIDEAGKLSEIRAIEIVQARYDRLLNRAMSTVARLPTRMGSAIINGKPVDAVTEQRAYIESSRRLIDGPILNLCDLRWEDVFAIISHVIDTIAEIEWLDEGRIVIRIFEGNPKFVVIVSTNSENLSRKIKEISKNDSVSDASFTYVVSCFNIGIVTLFACNSVMGALATEIALEEASKKSRDSTHVMI